MMRRAGLRSGSHARGSEAADLTEEQKAHWDEYKVGDRLLFARATHFFKRGAAAVAWRCHLKSLLGALPLAISRFCPML